MNYIIWNKKDKINGVDAQHFISKLNIRENDGVFLIGSDLDNVKYVEIDRIIKLNYNLDVNLTTEQVAQEYIRIMEEEKLQVANEQSVLDELANKISILECENKALKEELTQIQTSIASLTSLIATTLEEK